MRRREFIAGLGAAAASARSPVAAQAQHPDRPRRVGVLMAQTDTDPEFRSWLAAFVQEFARLGWVDGVNVRIDQRWTNYDPARGLAFARELIKLQPDVMLVGGTTAAEAVHEETNTVPTVFLAVPDPVGSGFVAGLPHPGGNMTGFVSIEGEMGGKWLQLLREVAPDIRRAAAMFNPDNAPYKYFLDAFEGTARSFAIEPVTLPVRNDAEIERAIISLGRERGGLVIFTDGFMGAHRGTVIAAATSNNVPTIFDVPFFPRDGGLLSYGPSFPDLFRRAAVYVDRILKGEKPADLPVQLPIKYVMAINLRTAKKLGLTVPNTILVTADEVIE
jgi:putative tryptophan/tyrosine transport system substrate-binding protein